MAAFLRHLSRFDDDAWQRLHAPVVAVFARLPMTKGGEIARAAMLLACPALAGPEAIEVHFDVAPDGWIEDKGSAQRVAYLNDAVPIRGDRSIVSYLTQAQTDAEYYALKTEAPRLVAIGRSMDAAAISGLLVVGKAMSREDWNAISGPLAAVLGDAG